MVLGSVRAALMSWSGPFASAADDESGLLAVRRQDGFDHGHPVGGRFMGHTRGHDPTVMLTALFGPA